MDAVTIVVSRSPALVAKEYSKVNGEIVKSAIGDITDGYAVTRPATNAQEMASLLQKVTLLKNAVICPGVWKNSHGVEKFSIVTERKLAELMDSKVGEVQGGVLYYGDEPVAARLKRGIDPSSWILLDADNPPGMPESWARMTIAQRLMLWEMIVPGISKCERIELRASSARVMNGSGSKPKTHAWIRVSDPQKIALLKAHIAVEMVNKGVSFSFEKKSRIDRTKTVGIEARSVFDLAVFDTGRLVFCSEPILGEGMDDYSIDDAGIEIVNEGAGPLDISWVTQPTRASLSSYKEKTGVQLKISNNSGGISVDSYGQLTMRTEIERRGEVKSLEEWLEVMAPDTTLRCESPFRESKSEAAFISKHSDGTVIVHDVGNSTNYKLGPAPLTDELGNQAYKYSVNQLKWDEFVIDGFIKVGITVIAGAPGVGKTSLLVPLACHAAHLCDPSSELKPVLRRKVTYVTEDPGQVERILYGMRKHGYINMSDQEFAEWFEIVPAMRLPAERLAQFVQREIQEKTVEGINGYKTQPLIVMDTSNATIDLDSENDNSEAGRAIALIKQQMDQSAIWLVAHTSKVASKSDVNQMSARGAGAFEGDANAVSYLVNDPEIPDARFLVLGKRRFEAAFTEVKFTSEAHFEEIRTPWGMDQKVWYRYGIPSIAEAGEREDLKKQAKEEATIEHREGIRGRILAALLNASKNNSGIIQRELKQIVGGNGQLVSETLDAMVSTGLIRMVIGAKNSKTYFSN